jgi:hypothetical protein
MSPFFRQKILELLVKGISWTPNFWLELDSFPVEPTSVGSGFNRRALEYLIREENSTLIKNEYTLQFTRNDAVYSEVVDYVANRILMYDASTGGNLCWTIPFVSNLAFYPDGHGAVGYWPEFDPETLVFTLPSNLPERTKEALTAILQGFGYTGPLTPGQDLYASIHILDGSEYACAGARNRTKLTRDSWVWSTSQLRLRYTAGVNFQYPAPVDQYVHKIALYDAASGGNLVWIADYAYSGSANLRDFPFPGLKANDLYLS